MSKSKLDRLLQEHDELFDEYVAIAQEKELKQNGYVKQISVTNQKTGEVFQLQHSLQKKLLEQHAILEQKIGYIHYLAKERDLSEVYFLTITAPSQYHPFKDISGTKRLNKNFSYDSISEAIPASYKAIERISRTFYKALKERLRGSHIDDKLLFVKVNEFHESYIVHQHLMIMLPKDIKVYSKTRQKRVTLGTWAKDKFYAILKKEDFNYSKHPYRKTNDFKKIHDDGRSISQYMMKYIQKTLSMAKSDAYGGNSTLYFLYGWKTVNRIRHYTTSNTPFNQIEYQKLYRTLKKPEKEKLVKEAKKQKTNLMTELSKIVSITRKTIGYDGDEESKNILKAHHPLFVISSEMQKIKTYSHSKGEMVDTNKLEELTITENNVIRYNKSDFSA